MTSDLTVESVEALADARFHLAGLIWCWEQGYTHPDDRALSGNWLIEDAVLHPDDVVAKARLLVAADEVLAALGVRLAADVKADALREIADQLTREICDGNYNPDKCETCRAVEVIRGAFDG